MSSRRDFLIMSAGIGTLLVLGLPACTRNLLGQAQSATAVTQVFGDGVRLTAVAVEYPAPVASANLSAADFQVAGRTVTGVFASGSSDPADRATAGRFVIVALSPEDANATLAEKLPTQAGSGQPGSAQGGRGPGNAGDIPTYDTAYRPAQATLTAPGAGTLATRAVKNLIVDDFRQLAFHDPGTGDRLQYNLFVPRDYDPQQSYPLVLFMHDAGATSDDPFATLFQGLGAIVWASPEDQARRPCFVLAPQFAEIIADDDSRTSSMLDTTIDLIEALANQYSIDRKRLYTTGQSGGCMMSIAMDIKYPDFFAASFLVAGQWDPALVQPLARQKLWILVSQDDDKAYPGQNAITEVLEAEGARISRATWDGTWNAEQYRAAFEKIDAEGSPINYVSFAKGSVLPPGDSGAGASGHRNTWRIAYSIEPIREWIFRQHG
ncbi:PHB depolymerase family esterase [Phytopseudomonas dryadis]|uniref:Peptidase n=1 Tax=Phytopseudomonas dryadis TaxID=2487520 RepID=A0A4Q9QWA4_9GAMM|nr:PHB depolymerase family esterase [Pseudomonas dryadis]TBU88479.1 peptidase [Pseudomonas dryadis]